MESRTYWVDYAKAIGILLVVYGHVARGLENGGIVIPEQLFGAYQLTDSIVYSFHMPLFFFLSGLFFQHSFSKRGGGQLVLSKIDTVFYPYVLWSIIQGCTEVLLSHYTNGDLTLSRVFTLLWSPRAQFWFLYALFFVFVAASLIFSLVPEKFTLVIFILAVLANIFRSHMPPDIISTYISRHFVFFAFGIIFSQYFRADRLASPFMLLMMLAAFIGSQYLYHRYLLLHEAKTVFSLLLALVSIMAVVSLSAFLARKYYRTLAYLGYASMAIYLMHTLAGSGTRVILKSFLGVTDLSVHLLLGNIMAVLGPIIALRIIDHYNIPYLLSAPISRWLKLSYRKIVPTSKPSVPPSE
ncbi:acyltransferase family protein [Gynuella sunshinyii]|uniref:Fucose 4-O-acetylase and related acetyltransferase n=1 Tax=Gynuella sunshinyii YC6258 TaxID=1445510 RepID=A0A0C5UZV5_9GAMM|nr:acyltransferase [Gynuella sunshinyii]AJQ92830.1 fucose 4-O-acetylase and related acetyltransferase [Gynuella sunshinyii YC6258]